MSNTTKNNIPLYRQDVPEALESLLTSKTGLSHQQALHRLEQLGTNELQTYKQESVFRKFLRQFKDPLILLLIGAALLALGLGDYRTGGILFIIVVINLIISYNQEQKAEKIMQNLLSMVHPQARVFRDGNLEEVNTSELVVGDIIYIEEGNAVPADCRVIEEDELATNDFALTGESNPSRKFTHAIKSDVILNERHNLVFMGTTVATGNAHCLVIATGMNTELGRIANLSQTTNRGTTPLQAELSHLAYRLTAATLILSVLLVLIALGSDLTIKDAVIFAIGIASAMIPQGLPAEINISLAQAAKNLAANRALVKRLKSVETLGSTSIICTDKTGTLTQNQMTIEYIHLPNQTISVTGNGYEPKGSIHFSTDNSDTTTKITKFLITGAVFASNASIAKPDTEHNYWYCIGDPTEGSIITLASKIDLQADVLNNSYKELKEFPFDSSRKMMSSIRVYDDNLTVFVKGSPEEVLQQCVSYINEHGKVVPLTQGMRALLLKQNTYYAQQSYRNLAVAYSYLSATVNYKVHDPAVVENNLTYIGMVSMADPVRLEVPQAMLDAHTAHIKINIITGDYAETAKAIAQKANLAEKNTDITVITGAQLTNMPDTQLATIASQGSIIFSRVAPEDKLRIVKLLQQKGFVVAVTGDGINDAPALKQANIGVAMGNTGTDVAKEAAEIVLLDDSFHTLVGAIKEGRTVFQNIKKATMTCLTSNFGELITVLIGAAVLALAGVPPAISPVLILAIDLIAELIPIAALGWDTSDDRIMKQQPRNLKKHIYDRTAFIDLLYTGIIIGVLAYGNYLYFLYRNGQEFNVAQSSALYASAITLTYLTIVLCQLANIFIRRTTGPTFSKYLFSNKHLLWAMVLSLVCVSLIIYTPPLQFIFGSGALGVVDWLLALIAAVIFFVIRESTKLVTLRISTKS